MALLEIVTYPDERLREKSKIVENIDDDILKIIADMAETMYHYSGVGLAAIQVGIDKQIVIIDYNEERGNFIALINPKIIKTEGLIQSENEGCLSVPEYRTKVERYKKISVSAKDAKGNDLNLEFEDFPAIVVQHELDHLDGKLFIDRISRLKRNLYKSRLAKKAKKEKS